MPRMARLLEHTLCEARAESIDKEAGTIRNVKVLGRESRRGRRYSDKALQDATKLYEGMRVNFDHPRDESKPGVVRGFFEQIGQLRGCYVAGDGVYAKNLDYLKSHPGAAVLVECVERFPNLLGLSHNANGPKRREGDTWIVEGIDEVLSVDIVTRPATTTGLFESEDEEMSKPRTLKLKAILESVKSESDLSKRLKGLLEQDVAMADMTAELPAESDPNEDVKAALAKAAQSIVRKMIDGDMEQQAGFKKLKELLGMAEKATADDSGKAPEAPAMESLQREFTALKCKNLLLESGREAKPEWIKALSASDEADRKTLLESLPKPAPNGQRPARSPGVLQESERGGFTPSTDAKDFLQRVKRAS